MSNNENEPLQQRKQTSQIIQKFLNLKQFFYVFYEEQKRVPWQSLVGPGTNSKTNLSLVHMWYVFILSFIPVCSLLTGLGFIQPYLENDSTLCDWTSHRKSCESIIVLFITYRVGFAISLFFVFTSVLLMSNSKTDPDETSTLHTGFWIEKILIVLVLSCIGFAFPPSTFDYIWLYFILFGDLVVTCLQIFLVCDIVNDVHEYYASVIAKRKSSVVFWRCLLLFLEIIGPLCIIFTLAVLSCYDVLMKSNCTFKVMATFVSVSLIMLCLIFVVIFRRRELVTSLYVIAFIVFLIYKATEYMTSCDPDMVTPPNIVSPSLKTMTSILFLYITIIYALVRKDRLTHFYYFYWIISREQTDVVRFINEPITNDTNTPHNNTLLQNKNSNETLLDLSFDRCDSSKSNSDNPKPSGGIKEGAPQFKVLTVTYEEAFVHALLFFVSLKSTSVISGYFCLHQQIDGLTIEKPIASIVVLIVTSITSLLIYIWFLYCRYSDDIDPLWTTALVKSLFKFVITSLRVIFIEVPICLRNNTLSRYIYTLFYMFSFILSCVVLTPSFRRHFHNNSIFCEHIAPLGACISQDPSYVGLYRVLVTAGLFFFMLATLLINFKITHAYRNHIQHGCWLLKAIVLVIFFTVFMNVSSKLSRVWLYLSLLSTFIFTFVQLMCLLDFINVIQSTWSNTSKMTPTTLYYSSTSITTFLYVICTASFLCFYIFFAHNYHCKVTRLYISTNLALCLSASLISIHPVVKTGGLLRSAIVTSFCMYLTWSALTYNPDEKCNPLAHTIQMLESKPSRDIVSIIDTFFLMLALIYYTIRIEQIVPSIRILNPLILCRCCCNKSRSKKQDVTDMTWDSSYDLLTQMDERYDSKTNIDLIEKWLENCELAEHVEENQNYFGQKVFFGLPNKKIDQVSSSTKSVISNCTELVDKNSAPYNYWWFHVCYFIATSYSFMLLTHWIQPIPGTGFQVTVHWAIMCVRMLASSTAVLLYIWTLINPLLSHLHHYNNIS